MRWVTPAVLFLGVFSAVVSADSGEERSLQIMTRSSVYDVGKDKALYCKGFNIGPEDMEWVSNKEVVALEHRSGKINRIYVESRKKDSLLVLFLNNLTLEDEGNWVCRSKDLTINQTLNIIVGVKAEVDDDETKTADENKSVKLQCKILKGEPAPVVKWYRDNGIPITADDKYKLKHNSKSDVYTLEISKLDFTDEGNYLCKVTQERLSHHVSKTINLKVQYKPLFINDADQPYENQGGPGHSTILVEEYAVLNETKSLMCRVFANPPAKFKWYRRRNSFDSLIAENVESEGDTISKFNLPMRDENDAGEYKCSAKNDLGFSNLIFHVSLGEKPPTPDSISVVPESFNYTYIGFIVKCANCTFKPSFTDSFMTTNFVPDPKNLPVTGYSFQLTKYIKDYLPDWTKIEAEVEVDIEDPEVTTFAVGPLPNSTTFHVRVRSKNAAGYSTWLEMSTAGMLPGDLPHTSHVIQLTSTMSLLVAALLVILCY